MIRNWNSDPDDQPSFLTFGFRPFFLVGGLYAVIAMLAWVTWLMLHSANAVIVQPTIAIPAHLWHGHEMLFGFAGAVITGFMLTAVPGWTGARRVAGVQLVIMMIVWIAGRVVMWFSAFLPAFLVAAIDMAHLPLLAAILARGLILRPAPRNLIFLAILIFLTVANGAFHGEWTGLSEDSASWGLAIALLTTTLMVVILGGRVVPSFTRNVMIRTGQNRNLPHSIALLDKASIAGMVAVVGCYLFAAPDAVTGVLAAFAAVTNIARLGLWRWRSVLGEPILWSLHLAYLWIPVGLATLSTSLLAGWPSQSAALHLLAIGAIGGMTLAMMTRAPLGHTGRPLIVTRPIAVAYLLIAIAALMRGFGLDVFPADYFLVIFIAGALWTAGFLIFVVTYTPILLGPSLKLQNEN